MGTIVKLNTVQEYNMAMGVETLHPLMGAARTITRKARWYLWLLDKWQELMMTEKH